MTGNGIQAALHLVTALAFLVVPAYVFSRSPSKPTHRAFAILGIAGALFNGCSCLAALATDPETHLRWTRAAFLGAFLLLPVVSRFPTILFGDGIAPDPPWLEPLTWLVACGFALATVSGNFLTHVTGEGRAVGGPALVLWSVVIGATFLRFLVQLRQGMRAATDHHARNRSLYLLFGAFTFALGGLLDLVHRAGIDHPLPFPLAPAASLAFLACLSIAVVRHRFLDIEVVVHRGLVLSLLAPIVAGLFVVLGEALEGLFRGELPPDSPFPELVAAMVVAATFAPISNLLSLLVETYVIAEFKEAPGLRRFRSLPWMIGSRDVDSLKALSTELASVITRLESETRRPPD